ncbi:hypothetical protein ACU686_09325 [Yinghuangia aomiensis]
MVVLGSRRLSSITEMLTTGSIAVPVAAHAEVSAVAIVRERAGNASVSPVCGGRSRRVRSGPKYALAVRLRRSVPSGCRSGLRSLSCGQKGPRISKEAIADGEVRLAESLAGWKTEYPDVTVRPQCAHRTCGEGSRRHLGTRPQPGLFGTAGDSAVFAECCSVRSATD